MEPHNNSKVSEINVEWKGCLVTPLSNFSSKEIVEILNDFSDKHNNVVLAINAEYIVSNRQISVAIYQSLKSFQKNKNITRDLALEVIIRLCGTSQIGKALNLIGISDTTKNILLIAIKQSQEDMETQLSAILKNFKFEFDALLDPRLPIVEIETLARVYNCEPLIEEIEKAAIEKITYIDIL